MTAQPSQQTNSLSLPSLQSRQRLTSKHGQMPPAFKDVLAQLGNTPVTSSSSAHSKLASSSNFSTALSATHSAKLVTGIANQTHSPTGSSHTSRTKA